MLFAGFIGILFLPLVQKRKPLIELKSLYGDITVPANPSLQLKTWVQGEYQVQKEKYIEETIGFRPFFVRLYNQLQYDLYGKINANGVITGKSGFLYEENYIKTCFGLDFVGDSIIDEKVIKLAKINDTLRKKGVEIIVMLAPGKGTYYPEYFPEVYEYLPKGKTNYQGYKEAFEKNTVSFLDFQQWFLKMKPVTKHPLFSKNGIHWSSYGEVLVADSLIRYLQKKLPQYQLPELKVTKIISDGKIRERDGDIGDGSNLLFSRNADLKLAYPEYELIKKGTEKCPKVLVVADSYYWGLFNKGFSGSVFNNGDFWYYNQQVYPASYEKELLVKDIDVKKEIEKNQVVLIMVTDANLYKFAFGFIEQVYKSYFED